MYVPDNTTIRVRTRVMRPVDVARVFRPRIFSLLAVVAPPTTDRGAPALHLYGDRREQQCNDCVRNENNIAYLLKLVEPTRRVLVCICLRIKVQPVRRTESCVATARSKRKHRKRVPTALQAPECPSIPRKIKS